MIKLVGNSPIRKHTQKIILNRIVKPYKTKLCGNTEHNFTMYDTKNSKELGTIICFPEKIYRRDVGTVNSLYVAYLSAEKHLGRGVGSALLSIAKRYSKEIGCDGFVHLESTGRMSPFRIPHIFYRKKGMSSNSPKIDKMLDEYIKNGQDAIIEDFPILRMYYPPINNLTPQKNSVLKKCLDNIKSFFILRY